MGLLSFVLLLEPTRHKQSEASLCSPGNGIGIWHICWVQLCILFLPCLPPGPHSLTPIPSPERSLAPLRPLHWLRLASRRVLPNAATEAGCSHCGLAHLHAAVWITQGKALLATFSDQHKGLVSAQVTHFDF